MNENFKRYARYYDLLYSDKNYEQETDYIVSLIQQHAPRAKTVLELGCGTGRHACLLAQKKYNVHGIDLSNGMVDQAKQRSSCLENVENCPTFSCADLRTLALGKTFDGVLSLFHVVSYQITNQDLLAAFTTAANHLGSDGIFIFDCWYGPAVLTIGPATRVKRCESDDLSITRVAEPTLHVINNCVDVQFTLFGQDKKTGLIETFQEKHIMRYLFAPEVLLFFKQAGFELLGSQEWLTGAQPGAATWGVCFIGKKL